MSRARPDTLYGGGDDDICKGGKPSGSSDPDNASGCEQTSGAHR